MKTYRNNARVAGVLFLIATIAGVLSIFYLGIFNEPDYLIKINENRNTIITGALLLLIMAVACAGIGIWLYPVLRRYNETLAIGSVSFRIMEAIFHMIPVFGILPLLMLSKNYIDAGTLDNSIYYIIGSTFGSIRDLGSNLGLLAWCLGAIMYYYVFYQSKLIPRWLSGWGLIGIVLALVAVILAIIEKVDSMSNVNTLMNAPIAIQEMVLAIWLIVKGFNKYAINSLSDK